MAPSCDHSDAGAALCVAAAVGAVAAGVEQRRPAAQEAAVRPALLPVAEFGGPSTTVPGTQLHRRGLHAPAQVLFWPPGAHQRGRVQPDRRVKGEEVHLQETRRQFGESCGSNSKTCFLLVPSLRRMMSVKSQFNSWTRLQDFMTIIK